MWYSYRLEENWGFVKSKFNIENDVNYRYGYVDFYGYINGKGVCYDGFLRILS